MDFSDKAVDTCDQGYDLVTNVIDCLDKIEPNIRSCLEITEL